jgi:hypothetical protein
LALVQVTPHAPQLVVEVVRSASQPLLPTPSQSSNPAEQVGVQTPLVQLVEPPGLVQAFPQLPQSVTDV